MQSPFSTPSDAPLPAAAPPPEPAPERVPSPDSNGSNAASNSSSTFHLEAAPTEVTPVASAPVVSVVSEPAVPNPYFEHVAPAQPTQPASAPSLPMAAAAPAAPAPAFVPLDEAPRSPFAVAPSVASVPSLQAGGPQRIDGSWKMGEPDAVTAPRPGALAPLSALLLGGVLSCLLVGGGFLLGGRGRGVLDPVQQISGGYGSVNSDSGNAIVEAVKRVGPAVMNVDTTFGDGGSAQTLPDPNDTGARVGKGTGVVIDSKQGLMLTNAHVVAGAASIKVTASDGKKYSGRLVGADPSNDIALVKLSNRNLPQARLAEFTDSKQLRIGEWAIAIGNPFAQENTVTVGVISAVGRQVGPAPMPGKPGESILLTDMIQTDAAINPGNSGGPLCNIRGEVIGINTAILPLGQGLGFTIPINKAKAVAQTLLRNGGKVPYIGILMHAIDAETKKEFALKESKGIFVERVLEGSPAARAGLQNGDVIIKANGQAVSEAEAMQKVVRSRKIGDVVQLEISRSGKRRTLSMKIAAKAD